MQVDIQHRRIRSASIFLLLLYPVAVHLDVMYGRSMAPWCLLLLGLVEATIAGCARAWLGILPGLLLVALSAATLWLAGFVNIVLLMPVMIFVGLMILFGGSLLPGRTALITRFAELTEGELSDAIRRYTAGVTKVWTVIFLLLAMESTLLALLADLALWSLFTNFLNYLFVLAVFLIEFQVRRYYFPDRTRDGFIGFIKQLLNVDWRQLGR